MAGATAATGMCAAIAPFFPPAALVGLVPIVIGLRTHKEFKVQRDLVEDPARYDYERETQLRVERFPGFVFDYESQRERELAEYTIASLEVVGAERAMTRALERAMGAIDRHQRDPAQRQLGLAREFGDRAAAALELAADRTDELARTLGDDGEVAEVDQRLGEEQPEIHPAELVATLPDHFAAQLFRLGASAAEVEAAASAKPDETLADESRRPLRAVITGFSDLAPSKRDLAISLRMDLEQLTLDALR
ncbi:MAG: hypothetical protein M3P18_05625 [Actinomycetota bacterium]|nr:hypothetical protein [Actinomycetota bacterium]